MKYQYGVKPKNYHIITAIYIMLVAFGGVIILDFILNYGQLTIDLMYQISEILIK